MNAITNKILIIKNIKNICNENECHKVNLYWVYSTVTLKLESVISNTKPKYTLSCENCFYSKQVVCVHQTCSIYM